MNSPFPLAHLLPFLVPSKQWRRNLNFCKTFQSRTKNEGDVTRLQLFREEPPDSGSEAKYVTGIRRQAAKRPNYFRKWIPSNWWCVRVFVPHERLYLCWSLFNRLEIIIIKGNVLKFTLTVLKISLVILQTRKLVFFICWFVRLRDITIIYLDVKQM